MKKIFLIVFALFCALCVKAQYVNELAVDIQYPGDEKSLNEYQNALEAQADPTVAATSATWITNKGGSNWFLSLEGGLALFGAENYSEMDFKDMLSPTFGLTFGKWFSPIWGLRLSLGGASDLSGYSTDGGTWYIGQNYPGLNGIASARSYITQETGGFVRSRFLNNRKAYKDGYLYDVSYLAADLDFLVNVKNLFGTYQPKALFNPVIYGGIGYAHTLKDGDRTAVNNIMEKLGLQLNFSLSDRVDLYLEGEALLLPEVFDRNLGGDLTIDAVGNVKIGLTYHFGYRYFIKAPLIDQKKLDDLNAEINRLRKQLE
ncbi:MAG: hypothetical protein LBT25_04160 [Candidatus Symbiothrix sp.]|jgi:hypothetical protein|nr:hypothetical protein [Candidatus Symbiothrix sp.]